VRLKPLAGFMDGWAATGHSEGSGRSVGGWQVRIDHRFVTTELGTLVRQAWIDAVAVGSDHFLLWVEMSP